jgi:hypothetical protein
MPQPWQRFAVLLKGEAEPIEVQTTARDWADVEIDPANPKAVSLMFRVTHAALVRTGHDVPRDYDGFLEVLDGMPEALDEEDATVMDPTGREP